MHHIPFRISGMFEMIDWTIGFADEAAESTPIFETIQL